MFATRTVLLTFALAALACAPRVSKRAPEPHAAAPVEARPVAVAPVREARVEVAKSEPASVQTAKLEPRTVPRGRGTPGPRNDGALTAAASLEHPAPAQVLVAGVAEEPAEGYAHEDAKPAVSEKKSFYAYSDEEITQMRRRSREFKKLHDKLNSCTSKSERNIAKREQLRDKIIALQNTEYRTPRQERELKKLRDDERKMLSGRAENTQDCHALEGRLTEMLRATSTQGA